jgi:hypothetical protein
MDQQMAENQIHNIAQDFINALHSLEDAATSTPNR